MSATPHDHAGHDHHGAGRGHGRSHAGHGHGVSAEADRGRLTIALALIVAFMLVEVAAGIIAGSLALLSDAAHMLTDAASIVLALVAMRLAARPAKGPMTYGLKRAEILSAQLNGATLLVLGVLILVEGARRVAYPPDVDGGLVLAVALVGVVVNLAATWTLSQANRQSLNVEGAFQHLLTDLFAFIATAIAGAIILLTDFTRADGIAALLVAVLMVRAGWGLVRDSGRVLLEAAPVGVDVQQVGTAMAAFRDVHEVHDLHVWEVSSGFVALSAHVTVTTGVDCHDVRREMAAMIAERFHIDHTTLQMGHDSDRPLQIRDLTRADRR